MMMDIEARDVNDVKVVDIIGKLNTGTSPEAEQFINDCIEEGANKILLNFEELDYISSTGLRVVLATGKKLATTNGKLLLCSLNPTVGEVFKISGFSSMFGVFDNEDEALSNF